MAKTEWDDWAVIERILPPSWETKAKETGTMRRCRGFANAGQLLRVMMIHLVDGCSLRETAVRAAEGNLAQVSDEAVPRVVSLAGPGLDATMVDAVGVRHCDTANPGGGWQPDKRAWEHGLQLAAALLGHVTLLALR
jgi:hypothetical protein